MIWYNKAKAMGRSQDTGSFLYVVKIMRAADWFYKTTAWEACRDAYIRSVGGLCERCYAKGRITPGVIVHHKIHLTPENAHDPEITLSFDNLELLCRNCHAIEHSRTGRRYTVDMFGKVAT